MKQQWWNCRGEAFLAGVDPGQPGACRCQPGWVLASQPTSQAHPLICLQMLKTVPRRSQNLPDWRSDAQTISVCSPMVWPTGEFCADSQVTGWANNLIVIP
jgi:hypothetical protein